MPSLANNHAVPDSESSCDRSTDINNNTTTTKSLPRHANPASSDLMVPGLGSLVTLLSTKQIRYEGALFSANLEQNKITLANVRCFGTEDRPCARPVRPSDAVYEYVVFSAGAIVRMEITQGCPVLLPRSAPMRRDPAVCLVTTFGRKWNSEEPAEAPPDSATTTSSTTTTKAPGSRRLRFFPRRHSTGTYGGPRSFGTQLSAVPEEGSAQHLVTAGMEDYPEVETARLDASPPLALVRSPEEEEEMVGSPAPTHTDYAPGDEDSAPCEDRRRRRRRGRQRSRTAPNDEPLTHSDEDNAGAEATTGTTNRRRRATGRSHGAPADEDSAAAEDEATPLLPRRPRRRRRRRNTAPANASSPGVLRSWSYDSGVSLFSMLEGLLSPQALPNGASSVEFHLATQRLQEIQREIRDVSNVLGNCSVALEEPSSLQS